MLKIANHISHITATISLAVASLILAGLPAFDKAFAQSQSCTKFCDSSFMEKAKVSNILALVKTHDVNARNAHGFSPLHVAAQKSNNPKVLLALIKAGADIGAPATSFETTPLHLAAAKNGNPQVLSALIAAGADINAANKNGHTPLHLAAGGNTSAQVSSVLVKAGADLEARATELKATPLHLASISNTNPQVHLVLIGAGADIEARSAGGLTPLHFAAASNSPQVVNLLLDQAADKKARTSDGNGVLDYAAINPKLHNTNAYSRLK